MSETNINQNLDQDVTSQLDVSTNSDQKQSNSKQQEREWGPGTPKYYTDSMASYMLHQPQTPNAVEQKKAPEKLTGLKEFAQKVMKALNLKKDDEIIEEEVLDQAEETQVKEKDEVIQKDNLAKSMGDKIGEIKKEAEAEYEKSKDPMTRMVVELTDQLEVELKKETLDWNKIDLLVRQIAILLVQKMANNDHVTIQEEIKMMQQDVDKVRDTYNTKWELAIGITVGVISMVGGLVGLGGGVAGMAGAASQGFINTLKGVTDSVGLLNQGGQSAQKFVSSNAESKRQLYQYELERDRSHKQTTESSLQGNKSTKGSQVSQRDRAIEAAYRAFIQLAQ